MLKTQTTAFLQYSIQYFAQFIRLLYYSVQSQLAGFPQKLWVYVKKTILVYRECTPSTTVYSHSWPDFLNKCGSQLAGVPQKAWFPAS